MISFSSAAPAASFYPLTPPLHRGILYCLPFWEAPTHPEQPTQYFETQESKTDESLKKEPGNPGVERVNETGREKEERQAKLI